VVKLKEWARAIKRDVHAILTVLWILVILTCLALIAVLVFVIGSLADQTGEASPLQNQSVIFEMTRSS
jgi:hypothetical protein